MLKDFYSLYDFVQFILFICKQDCLYKIIQKKIAPNYANNCPLLLCTTV